MVTLNSEIRIQNRSGTAISTVSLDSFWAATGATGVFDPKLVYDPFNNRWIFATVTNARTAASSLLVGVTQTSDPTGNWNLYRVDVDATNVNWGDYPSLGFNKDWIVVSLNLFTISTNSFTRVNVYAFNKGNLYAGLSATVTLFAVTSGFTPAPAVTYDNTLATMHLVENWNGNSGGRGFLRLSTITGPIGAELYTAGTALVGTPNPWASAPTGGLDFAPQQGTTQKIQNNDSRILNAVYRNGSLWAAQSAFLPASSPSRTAAQWWELTPSGSVQQFGRVDDPTGVFFYAFPSIGVNAQNDVLLGYSSFSASQFASANYSFRAGTDPGNTLRSDVLLKAGEAVYYKIFSGTQNRWGDYSHTVVDPVNDRDLWTIQEYASSPNFPNGDNRWGTWWGKVVPPPLVPPTGNTLIFSNLGTITINDSSLPPTLATPYPSTIAVSAVLGTVVKVVVKLNGFNHTFPDDVDVLLVGPTGATAIVMSDVGGGTDVTGINLTLDDAAASSLPNAGPLVSGVFRPTNIGAVDSFPSPAQVPSGTSALSVFNGTNPNGTWSLYVVDGFNGDSGAFTGGWTLEIVTSKKRRGQLTSE